MCTQNALHTGQPVRTKDGQMEQPKIAAGSTILWKCLDDFTQWTWMRTAKKITREDKFDFREVGRPAPGIRKWVSQPTS